MAAVGKPWHVFAPGEYAFGTCLLRLKVLEVLWGEPAPRGWLAVRGVEYDYRGVEVDFDRRAAVRIEALRRVGVRVLPSDR